MSSKRNQTLTFTRLSCVQKENTANLKYYHQCQAIELILSFLLKVLDKCRHGCKYYFFLLFISSSSQMCGVQLQIRIRKYINILTLSLLLKVLEKCRHVNITSLLFFNSYVQCSTVVSRCLHLNHERAALFFIWYHYPCILLCPFK